MDGPEANEWRKATLEEWSSIIENATIQAFEEGEMLQPPPHELTGQEYAQS
jgi:hypothetical protein